MSDEPNSAPDWPELEGLLGDAFQTPLVEIEGERIFVSSVPVDLDGWLEPLREENLLTEVMGFEWASLGPMSWYSAVERLELGPGRVYACLNHEEEPFQAFAALEGENASWAWMFSDLCASNGGHYGTELFSDLPGDTLNRRPDLVPARAVRDGYRLWLDSLPETWFNLQEWVVRDAAHATHSTPEERIQARSQVDIGAILDRVLNDTTPANETFSAEQREFLLDLYFQHCYAERRA